MKFVVDGMGGDNAPKEIIKGVANAIKKFDDIDFVIFGDYELIKSELNLLGLKEGRRVEIVDAPDVISNDEAPAYAFKNKPRSSIVAAFDYLKTNADADGLISAGSTGALLTGAVLKLGRIKGVNRPAMAPILPTKLANKNVVLIDCGANLDSKPINLAQFALMGSTLSQTFLGVENPKVALLNVGTEDKKGNELCHQSFELIKNTPVNFVGNCEARDALSGEYDVIVSDGFSGNVLLKATEGAVSVILSVMKNSIKSRFMSKIGAIFMKKTFKDLKSRLDYNKLGGAPFVGVKKLVVKAHGSSKEDAIYSAIDQMHKLVENKFTENLSEKIAGLNLNIEAQTSEN